MTVRLLFGMAQTAMMGVNKPAAAMGMARTLT